MSHSVSGTSFTAYAGTFALAPGRVLGAAAAQALLDVFLRDLLERLRAAGCTLIGHIKGVLEAAGGESLFFNVTDFDHAAGFRNGLAGPVTGGRMTINVIVAGLEDDVVARAVESAVAGTLGGSAVATQGGAA